MAVRDELILGSDMTIELCNLRTAATGVLVTLATVTARVLDSAGDPVTGVPDPITLTEVSGRTGLYRGSIPDTAGYALGDDVTISGTATDTGGNVRIFTILATVVRVG